MSYRVLIVTADEGDRSALQTMLGQALDGPFVSEWVGLLSAALSRLESGAIDAVLLDLALPDSQGLASLAQLLAVIPGIPIMTLCAMAEQALALQALQQGAQGYLLRDQANGYWVVQSLRQIIQRCSSAARLQAEQVRAEITLNSIHDAVIGTDLAGQVDYLNLAAEKITGWSRNEAYGQPIGQVMQLHGPDGPQPGLNPIGLVLQQQAVMAMQAGTLLVRRDGTQVAIEDSAAPIIDPNGEISGAVVVFHDVTEARAMATRMAYLAQHDFLTKLPNRVLLNDRIAQAISLAERSDSAIALMFLDLDNFKQINDSLGHGVGDQLLQAVALRLETCVRSSDTVCRNGGDEFIVLLAQGQHVQKASVTAQKILHALAEAHCIEQHSLQVTCSIGISLYPADAADAQSLLANADTAMYHAKQAGRNNYQFFKAEMNQRAMARQAIESSLWQALERQEFVVHYQAKVALHGGAIVGAEALLRWQHPQWGLSLPERFLAIAEDSGLIVPIGRWVLGEACRQAQRWLAQGLELGSLAVNVSALEFRHADFVNGVSAALKASGLPAQCLQLEISERVLLEDAQASSMILQRLKGLGVQLAMDDFGTGASNLQHLLSFPIDVLKIDKSFVQAINTLPTSGLLARAVIAMGVQLQFKVVAEGIEDQQQLSFLAHAQCLEGQGHLFAEALTSRAFASLLRRGVRSAL